MMKTLVLAEKPSVGKEIARVLGCKRSKGAYIEGDKYIVTWAYGHLVTLAEPEHYGQEYKTWKMETLPMLPGKMYLKIIPETSKQFKVVKSLMLSNEVDSLIIATDAGREGELVARWIIEKAGFKKPIKRLWVSSQTDKAIKDGFKNLKDGKEYVNLYKSAQSRAEADWLVGLNATRALTCKYNAQLSAGRVQTPTLTLIVERENEIKKFVPKDYYNIKANLGDFFVTWINSKNMTAISDREKAEAIAEKVKGRGFRAADLKESRKKTPPPLLYDLTELQRDANKMYNYSPKETLNIMQRLYENHKILTYPRTDSRYITDDIVPTLKDRVKACAVGDFAEMASKIIRGNLTISKVSVNNAKVSDHHAIIPTEERPDISKLTNDERRIYVMVVKRFLSCFYPDYEYKNLRWEFECEGEKFYAKGRNIINKGWKEIYMEKDEDEEDDQLLPEIKKGSILKCTDVKIKSGKTSPPSRYTEASLLSAMENPSKYIEDKSLKGYIGGGLGTPATRADIIEKLFNAFYMEKRNNVIYPTSKGIQLVNLAPEDLKKPLLTAKWEMELESIKEGKEKKEKFISGIREYTKEIVKEIASSDLKYVHENLTKTPCPTCGKPMLKVKNKNGVLLVCQDRECNTRKYLSRITNVKCPNCHKKMEMTGEGEKRMYVCSCGYKERCDKFHEKQGGGGADKRTVQKYLASQKKNEDKGESALAKALAEAFKNNN
ncbi:MAG: DNA topoisomerase III [Firmicutes bacterium]|nr:DNA topoisomerase III [Bacillota bacterium]